MVATIVFNLGLIGYYKYAGFLVDSINAATGTGFSLGPVVLPLAISFFTFQQIAYVVDVYKGVPCERSLWRYTLFVTFFPQLIAGPVVQAKMVLPQFYRIASRTYEDRNLAVGMAMFAIGLIKKAVIADSVAVYANPVFLAADGGAAPDFFTAWSGALAYTFQLYFDFSGYSDMAVGAALMFGVRLPLNFNSPYKALSITEFWRRWHMTLSAFLRDYLYIALGGNRRGRVRRYANLMTTMALGGLWHGAGWTFVIWGVLHGLYLCINHGWSAVMPRGLARVPAYRAACWLMTFVAVVAGWVFFRAGSFEGAWRILEGMAGLNGVALPAGLTAQLGPLGAWLSAHGYADVGLSGQQFVLSWAWIIVLLGVALTAPNSQEILSRYRPALETGHLPIRRRFAWRLNTGWAVVSGIAFAIGLFALPRVSEFLYFQF
ncbi:MBOAT family O-acyltransferase [Pedomonas mirosovicensis]|uniref:MBOAT family O-acyltransferase n=1 Tax=Pedomonas mirosovicensis TaxID=2908641 RepID=UPI002168FF38|nr:MBOAT family O-acyltransferase [Pedomonas mirosovicensis]MCH8685532.1 MBOAT family protein [Pedomonas mirosovicensis]